MSSAVSEEFLRWSIKQWQKRLGLDDWDIRLSPRPPEGEGLVAQVKYRLSERVAEVMIDQHTPNTDIAESHVAHELVHLALKPYTMLAEGMAAQMKEPFRGFIAGALEDAEERVIESVLRSHGFERFVPYGELAELWPTFAIEMSQDVSSTEENRS